MVHDRGGADGAAFARSLESLKDRGCSLLVVGAAVEAGQTALCQRLLGEPTDGRRRLLVRTDGTCSATPADGDVPTHVVRRETVTRDVRAVSAESERPATPAVADLEDLEDLEAAVAEGLADLSVPSGEEPAELRFCLDSLLPLLAEHDPTRVRRSVARIGERVGAHDGMAHFHLPTARDHDYVAELRTVVDAVVETRVHQGRTEQRWHVLDGAVDSGWLSL